MGGSHHVVGLIVHGLVDVKMKTFPTIYFHFSVVKYNNLNLGFPSQSLAQIEDFILVTRLEVKEMEYEMFKALTLII